MTDRVQADDDDFDEWSGRDTRSGQLEYRRTLSEVSARRSHGSDAAERTLAADALGRGRPLIQSGEALAMRPKVSLKLDVKRIR